MSSYNFNVSITPKEALDLVHEEIHHLGNEVYIGTLVFEKYFMRVESRVALIVIIDNIYGHTDVRSISTGSSQGMFFKFDWGASEKFSSSVKSILERYII